MPLAHPTRPRAARALAAAALLTALFSLPRAHAATTDWWNLDWPVRQNLAMTTGGTGTAAPGQSCPIT
jgi:hypothetical protein